MIVKNEEQNLAACLSPVADLFDEIIVVDTGSTDRTKEIAVQQGASVFEFPWTDDFAAARNEALRHATGMWIFWLDADDRLDADNLAKLRQLMRDLPDANHAYMMRQLSVPDELTDSALAVDHARLFRRHPQVQWRYRVHEQILACLRESGAKLVWTDIVIRHLGYQDPSQRQRKHDRNLRILRMELEEKPDDSFILFNLAATYMEHGQVTTAMPYLSRCLEKAHAGVSFLPKVYVLLTRGSQRLGRNDEALRYCREGKQRFPEEAELWFEEGSFLLAHGELAMARLCFERILGLHSRRNYVGVDASLCSSHTRHNLALIYRGLKMPRQAEEQWRIVTQQTPEFGSAWMGLVETYLDQHRQSDLDALLLSLQGSSFGLTILPALQARVALAKGDYAGARKTLESAIAVSPKALWLRFVLTEILLLVGKDEEAAMQQLKAILALDPQHAQARQKLEQLEFRG
jgi:tetratricopeptide (TPR) repeat protein